MAEPGSSTVGWAADRVEVDRPDTSGGAAGVPRRRQVLLRFVPRSLHGARLDPGRRGAILLCLVALLAATIAACAVWSSRPRTETLSTLPVVSVVDPAAADPPAPGPGAASGSPAPSAAPAQIVVSVTGKVRRPGLVTLSDGARVADVVEAAGGALPGVDLAGLNLARRVSDGEQVAVGVPAAPDAAPAGGGVASGGGAGTAPAGPIDLNTAGVGQLDALPGVGPVTAQRIVEWRARNGRFSRVEQLREIEGIGERRFEQLRALVRV